jgi:rhodanese-related sulfurtransferase
MKLIVVMAGISLAVACTQGCDSANASATKQKEVDTIYSCIPCGSGCDTILYQQPGNCSHCNMELVKKNTILHKNMEPENMCSLNKNEVVFLDVRTPEEFNGTAEQKFGAIKNAVNIPVQQLQQRINELQQYKNKKLVVYCSHSHRSPRASYILTQAGFTNVTNMQSGMSVWKERVKDEKCNAALYVKQ